jgi:hypothetical protein
MLQKRKKMKKSQELFIGIMNVPRKLGRGFASIGKGCEKNGK